MRDRCDRWWSLRALVVVSVAASAWAPARAVEEPPRPAGGQLLTRFAADVDPAAVLPEYPRPQLARPDWLNLNGRWDYAIRPRVADAGPALVADGTILVPFPVESALGGVRRTVGADRELVYRRSFTIPAAWDGRRVLLHFGAVDWEARVFVDGTEVGSHRGGYDPFSFDITAPLDARGRDGAHELTVIVHDPTDAGPQPRGKQVAKPEGIWYTPVTGIWQTVWLEPVPVARIDRVRVEPILAGGRARVTAAVVVAPGDAATPGADLRIRLSADGGRWRAEGPSGAPVELSVPGFAPWSPDTPQLYELAVELVAGDRVVDRATTWFGMRSVGLGRDANGMTRILLNGKPTFMFGPLDQGWWPDGLYTAPTDAALVSDLEVTKRLGFNMVRKHVKVEPARWYHHCDRLGLLVWQDMPSGDANMPWPRDGTEGTRAPDSTAIFGRELAALLEARGGDTCIVAWVPFNEGWGQAETVRWTGFVKERDPGRLVISASGGNDFGVGDVRDIHFYPQPEFPPAEDHRASVLGEYGGLGLPLAGHTWQGEKNWGYRQFADRVTLQETYLTYIDALRPMVESHLAAAVYTQTSDVEVEVNGLLTYDREVLKFDAERLAAAHRGLYGATRSLSPRERVAASVIAWWRFEEGEPGQPLPHDREARDAMAVRDSSGHRNHLYAYGPANAPRCGTAVPADRVPQPGVANTRSLDDTAALQAGLTRDLYTDPGRSRTHMDAIDTFPFTGLTIEVSVRPAEIGPVQTLVGKDGRPTGAPTAPLQVFIGADGRPTVELVDGSGAIRSLVGADPLPVGQWRHLAVVGDGSRLRMYVGDGAGYRLAGECPIAGGIIPGFGTWTVGRGHDDGRIGRDARADIDEVRVSTRPLPVESFLWSPAG
jgi:hypothetical protein